MPASYAAELFKLAKRPAVWLISLAWWLLALVFGYVFPYLAYRSGAGPRGQLGRAALLQALPADLVPSAVQGFPLFAGALALLLGVLVTGNEYTWSTLKILFTQGPSRTAVLAGKFSALLTMVLAIVLVSFALDAGASLVIASTTNSAAHWPAASTLVRGIGAGWLMVSMWSVAGALLGVLARGTALAAGAGLVWALAIENLLRAFSSLVPGLATIDKFLPGTNAGALAAALGTPTQDQPGGTPGITAVVGAGHAVAVLAGYVTVCVLVSLLLIHRRPVLS